MLLHLLNIVPIRIADMPTKKTRINLSVDDDMNELLIELAALQGIPKATLVTDYLEMLRPHLVEIRDAIRMVNEKKDPAPHLRKMLMNTQQDFLDVLKEELKYE
jgi:hypothetical protein